MADLKDYELAKIIIHPSMAEKSVSMIDTQNKIVFIVDERANKTMIKEAVEKLYKVKVDKVNTIRDQKNRKKAIVKINKAHKAEEIATALGLV